MRRILATLLVWIAISGCHYVEAPRSAIVRDIPSAPTTLDPDSSSISVTWVGHATALIRIDDRWILTDPVLFDRIAWVYPRRVAVGIDIDELPDLDAVLISHAHFDHLDVPSLRHLPPTKVVAVPRGAVKFLPDDLRVGEVAPMDDWDSWEAAGIKITAVPASHGDGRYLVDRWNTHTHVGYVIEYRGHTVYFAGDTGFVRKDAEALAERFDIDVALIPVGPAGRWKWVEEWRADVHVNPEQALALFVATGAQWMIPVHFGTFFVDPDHERPYVVRAIEDAGLERLVRLLEIGETTEFLY